MPVLQPTSTVRFGLFEVDTQARELYRSGVRIRLAPQPFDLLTALLEQPGTVVSRESLQARLWPANTYVDFEHGLNKTVRKLREALGDSAESPRYIETVQRSGYRFIAPVQRTEQATAAAAVVTEPPVAAPPLQPTPTATAIPAAVPERASGSHRRLFLLPVSALVLLAAVAVAFLYWRHRTIKAPASAQTTARTVDPRALEAYQHGRHLWFGEHPTEASDYFKRAVEIQPDYGDAWAGMALYYGALLVRGKVDPAENLGLESEAAAKAIQFAPDSSVAHLAACGSLFLNTWDYARANAECERAVQLGPGEAETYHFQSKMLAAVHREEDALRVQRTSSRLDPLSRPWALGQALMQARHFDEALSESRSRLESFPHDSTLLRLLADISQYRGSEAQAADYLEQSYRYAGDEASASAVRDAYRHGGWQELSRWRLEDLKKKGQVGYVSPVKLALAYINTGDRENALLELETALRQRSPEVLWVRCYPEFDPLQQEPRYQQILAALPTLPAGS